MKKVKQIAHSPADMARLLTGRRDGDSAQEWMFCVCSDSCPPDIMNTRDSLSVRAAWRLS